MNSSQKPFMKYILFLIFFQTHGKEKLSINNCRTLSQVADYVPLATINKKKTYINARIEFSRSLSHLVRIKHKFEQSHSMPINLKENDSNKSN